ncbi:MAG TPA: ABC transporter substrate-binding protein [Propionibacteriaceae bacterium]
MSCSVLAVTACAGGESSGSAPVASKSAEQIVLKVGIETGLAASHNPDMGNQMLAAAEGFTKWNNENDTGVKIEIVDVVNDLSEPGTAAIGMRNLLQKGAQAVVGDHSSSTAKVLVPIANEGKAIYTVVGGWADELTGTDLPYVFRLGTSNNQIAAAGIVPFLKHLHETEGLERVGILADQSAFGVGLLKVLEGASKDGSLPAGVDLHGVTVQVQQTDVTAQLLQLKKKDVQLVLIAATSNWRDLAVKQAHQVGVAPAAKILAAWNFPPYPQFWDANGASGIGVYYVNVEGSVPPNEQWKLYESIVGDKASIWGAWTWDSMLALQKAALIAKSGDGTALIKAMEQVEVDGATGPIGFHADGEAYHDRKEVVATIRQMQEVGQTEGTLVYEPSKG